ncbi:mitochondrial 37S ribosomal protein uS10m [Magnusiomyces paraingens]|uniref:Small ribosomal subunit protein uS10m n=1 Tax=Magnusiomyces paraingens TaxID=2606893 RepID=A0A5E8BQ13_9ASCO|nr:uncharacterized protein SAPINGB_P003369 [Saprochaete ingens]VVT53031.1 unnamed protein product [Saprochaete ingens]
MRAPSTLLRQVAATRAQIAAPTYATIRTFSVSSNLQSPSIPTEIQLANKVVVDDSPNYAPSDLYPSEGTFVPSSTKPSLATGRPVPLNVKLNEYAPLRHPKTHGHLVAEIQMRAFETQDLDFFADFALRAAFYLKMPVSGVIPLPTRRERWTVIRSPFVHAKSKENFERRTHKRVIKVYDSNPEVIETWLATLQKHSMSGIGMKAHMYTREDINVVKSLDNQKLTSMTPEELAAEQEHLHSISSFNPTNVHFGNDVNRKVAKEVIKLLSDPVFKPHLDESNKDTSPGAPELAIKEEK